MCGGGDWNPIPSITETIRDIPSTVVDVTRDVAGEVKDQATIQNLSYAAPYTLLTTDAGRKQLQETYGPVLGPALNLVNPQAGALVNQYMSGGGATRPTTTTTSSGANSSWDALASLFRSGASGGGPGVGEATSGGAMGGGISPLVWIIGGIGAFLVLILALFAMRK